MKVWQKALHCEPWHRWFAWHPVEAGQHLVWLQWIERRRCYALIDQWWEVRLPATERHSRKIVLPQTGVERHETLAVSMQINHAVGEGHGAHGPVQVPQDALRQDRAAA